MRDGDIQIGWVYVFRSTLWRCRVTGRDEEDVTYTVESGPKTGTSGTCTIPEFISRCYFQPADAESSEYVPA